MKNTSTKHAENTHLFEGLVDLPEELAHGESTVAQVWAETERQANQVRVQLVWQALALLKRLFQHTNTQHIKKAFALVKLSIRPRPVSLGSSNRSATGALKTNILQKKHTTMYQL